METAPFSDLLRHTTATVARLARTSAIRLQRRDATDLVLMSAERAEADIQVAELTARLLGELWRTNRDSVREALPRALPWVRFLPDEDRDTMAAELADTAEAAASLGSSAAVSQLLTEWRHTAEIHADPDLHRALTATDTDDFGQVPRPSAA